MTWTTQRPERPEVGTLGALRGGSVAATAGTVAGASAFAGGDGGLSGADAGASCAGGSGGSSAFGGVILSVVGFSESRAGYAIFRSPGAPDGSSMGGALGVEVAAASVLPEGPASIGACSARTPRPTWTPSRNTKANTDVVSMNRKPNCFPLNWIS